MFLQKGFTELFSRLLPSSDTAGGEAAPAEGTFPTLDGAVTLDMKKQNYLAFL